MNKKKLVRWLYYKLGDDHGGNSSAPGSAGRLEFGELGDDGRMSQIATVTDSELWLGYRWKWHVFYEAKHARRLAWFILWTWWTKGTWCGLKRKIWRWALHLEVANMMKEKLERR